MLDLYKVYADWIDTSMYDGCETIEEEEAVDRMLMEKYGTTTILRPDAPPDVVAAYKEDMKADQEAAKRGEIID